MQRRTFSRHLLSLALLGSAATGGCGFALRQDITLPFRSIALTGFAENSPLATELARALESHGVEVVEAAKGPDLSGHVIFEALTDGRQQIVASSTAFGQVRDLTLRTKLRFQLLRADGTVLLAPTELLISRDLTYNEKDALAKQTESEALHRAMQSDIVAQVLRRLSVIPATQLSPR